MLPKFYIKFGEYSEGLTFGKKCDILAPVGMGSLYVVEVISDV